MTGSQLHCVPNAKPFGLDPEPAGGMYVDVPVGEVPAGLLPSGVPAGTFAGMLKSAVGTPGLEENRVELVKSTLFTR